MEASEGLLSDSLDIIHQIHARTQRKDRGSQELLFPENHKAIAFHSNTGPDLLEKASIQCWAIIGLQAKRHLSGVSLAGP